MSGRDPKMGDHRCEVASDYSKPTPGARLWDHDHARDHRAGYGGAIDSCYGYDDGQFWAANGEYGSLVNFCPFCGEKAPVQAWRNEKLNAL